MTRLISTMIVLTAVILTGLLFTQLGAASAPATVPASTPTGTITPPQPGTPTPTRTATSTVEPKPGTVTALRAGTRPVIDGNLDEWQTLAQTLLNKDTASSISGEIPVPADLSAGLRAAWAPEALYFAAAMADDVLVGSDSPQIWGDDSVELSVRAGGATHQFTVALDGRQADRGVPITSLTVATRTVPGGWALEVAVPATALGLTALAAGGQYPFTFALWDDDLRTYPGQTHMIWQGSDTYTYQPDWGMLDLSSTVYDFASPSPPRVPASVPPSTATWSEWQALPGPRSIEDNASSIEGAETNPALADLSAGLRAAGPPRRSTSPPRMADDVLVGNDSPRDLGRRQRRAERPRRRRHPPVHRRARRPPGRPGEPITSLTVATRTVPGGWTLEVAVPAAALGLASFTAGGQYPFTFGLWDETCAPTPARPT